MINHKSVKVSNRFQIALPSEARRKLNIHAGDRLLVDIQDGAIVLVPRPDSFTKNLAGLYANIWKELKSAEYLAQERNDWKDSESG